MKKMIEALKNIRVDNLSPRLFFTGVLLGFVACCLAGYLCSKTNTFSNFHRFHVSINAHTVYYPSALQMINLIENSSKPDQIIVVIAGDSVLYGHGEKGANLWSDKLQQDLGDRYKIVNLSFEGTFPFEGGYWAAEALAKRGRKVIVITNAEPTEICLAPGYTLRATYFDFRNRDLLMDYPVRDEVVNELIEVDRGSFNETLDEQNLCKNIDRVTNSTELWNWIAYNGFFTIWSHYQPWFILPKKIFSDDFVSTVPPDLGYLKKKAEELKRDHSFCATQNADGEWVEVPDGWKYMDKVSPDLIPLQMRSRSIVLLPKVGPRMTDLLTPYEKQRNDAIYEIGARKWQEQGYNAVVIGKDFGAQDYVDMNHFSPSASQKVADMVATEVHAISKRSGYEN